MGGLRGAGGPGADHCLVTVRAAREYRLLFIPRQNPLRRSAKLQQLPTANGNTRLARVGGMVMPGGVRRDPDAEVNFSLYDAREGAVTVSYMRGYCRTCS